MLFTVARVDRIEGLLFSSDVGLEKVLEFIRSRQQFIKLPAFVSSAGADEFFVSQYPVRLPQADKAREDQIFYTVSADTVETYSPYLRFNQCTLLIKVMGCDPCEFNRKDCHERGGAFPGFNRDSYMPFDPEVVFKAGKAKGGLEVAGVTYVPPAWTKTATFQDKIRPAHEHDFGAISENVKSARDRSLSAAVTRKGHREECSRCLFGMKRKSGQYYPGCDKRVSRCHGPFDTEEAQQKSILEVWDPRVEEFLKTAEFTRNQFWAIAQHASDEAKCGRKHVVLSGWEHHERTGFTVGAVRSRTEIRKYPFANENYGEVREIFSDLPRDTRRIEVPSDTVRALWYLSLQATQIRPSQGWGREWRDIVYRRVRPDKVLIKTAATAYFSWGEVELFTFYQAFLYLNIDPPLAFKKRDQS